MQIQTFRHRQVSECETCKISYMPITCAIIKRRKKHPFSFMSGFLFIPTAKLRCLSLCFLIFNNITVYANKNGGDRKTSNSGTVVRIDSIHVAGQRHKLVSKGIYYSNDSTGRIVDARWCNFKGVVSFDNFHFKQLSLFSFSSFEDSVSFDHDIFNDHVRFTNAEFKGLTNFHLTNFKKYVIFTGASFSKEVYFTNARFSGLTDFQNAKFQELGDFSFLRTGDTTDINFIGARLPDMIEFSYVKKISNPINFTNADFSRPFYDEISRRWHYISLFNSDIANVRIDYQHFRLYFYNAQAFDNTLSAKFHLRSAGGFTFGSDKITVYNDDESDPHLFEKLVKIADIRDYLHEVFPAVDVNDHVVRIFLLHWLHHRLFDDGGKFPAILSRDEVISLYEKVLKNFSDHGQQVSYEALDIEYKNFTSEWPFLENWNAYGYKKAWIFRNTGYLLLGFSFITMLFFNFLNRPVEENGVYFIKNIPQKVSWARPHRRIWYSLLYTSAIFFLLSLEISQLNFKRLGVIYIFLVYSVGILCLAYIANFVIQK